MHTQCERKYTNGLADIIQMVVLLDSFPSLYFPSLPWFLQEALFISVLEKIVFSWNIHLQRSLWPEMMSNYKAGPWKTGICLALCPCRRHFQRPPTPVGTSLWLQALRRTSVSLFYGYAKMLSTIKAASRNKSLLGLQFQRASLWLS